MKPLIAVIEDSPDNRLLIQAFLEDDYEVSEYENGVDALELMPNRLPELVLLDISLPVMDGVEVLRRMREDERMKQIPIVALTAHAMSGDREKYLSLGFDEYISKPIWDEQILFDVIARLTKK
ncbi:MAG: response regulator [Candidatus Melainabacteria bacterium HGW-Melainabacteria-1]|nr:MAG: response regulator [Candidatus Melainabacteria bacterium HGW-Melainabacteria-1]